MKYLTGKDRNQLHLFLGSLEEAIESDHKVRLLEALDLSLAFTTLNLRCIFNILPKNALKGYQKAAIQFLEFFFASVAFQSSPLPTVNLYNPWRTQFYEGRLQAFKMRYIKC